MLGNESTRASIVRRHLARPARITHPGTGRRMLGTAEDAAALALINKARSGDVRAFRLIFDSVYGRPKRDLISAYSVGF
jgi:hypothetical protein